MAERKNNNRRNNKDYDDDYKARKIRKKACPLCTDKDLVLDYKNPEQLRKFVNERGKILPRRTTGACAKHQREVSTAIKRAGIMGLLPFVEK